MMRYELYKLWGINLNINQIGKIQNKNTLIKYKVNHKALKEYSYKISDKNNKVC